jgi:hypothetical protein
MEHHLVMDGNHRDTPLGPILASIPIQALLIVGVAAGLVNAVHSQPTQYAQHGQSGIDWSKPGLYCVTDGGSALPDKGWQGDDPERPVAAAGGLACAYANPAGQPVAPMPCCGDSFDNNAP